jgi:heme exporter protein CcmD
VRDLILFPLVSGYPNMQRLIEILGTSMGGYGVYVWPSFLIALLVMAAMALLSLCALRRASLTLATLQSSAADET